MGYIGKIPSAVPLTSADITDSIITSAKIVDGTIALADLSATGTKDSTTFLRGDNTFAVAGGTNTPAFYAYIGDSTFTSGVSTKLSVTEVYDTNNAYDGTKFTVPSGKAGKYFFYVSGTLYATGGNATYAYYSFYKNNVLFKDFELYNLSAFRNHNLTGNFNVDLSVGDYIELYAIINGSGTTGTFITNFGGFKLVE